VTGPEHAAEAEEAITASTWQRQEAGEERNTGMSSAIMVGSLWEMVRAQVHATLAVARELADLRQLTGGIRDEIKGLR
jgi:hypothetical protein